MLNYCFTKPPEVIDCGELLDSRLFLIITLLGNEDNIDESNEINKKRLYTNLSIYLILNQMKKMEECNEYDTPKIPKRF